MGSRLSDGPASDQISTEVLSAIGVTAGAVGSGAAAAAAAAAGGGVQTCPMNLGAASKSGC